MMGGECQGFKIPLVLASGEYYQQCLFFIWLQDVPVLYNVDKMHTQICNTPFMYGRVNMDT